MLMGDNGLVGLKFVEALRRKGDEIWSLDFKPVDRSSSGNDLMGDALDDDVTGAPNDIYFTATSRFGFLT